MNSFLQKSRESMFYSNFVIYPLIGDNVPNKESRGHSHVRGSVSSIIFGVCHILTKLSNIFALVLDADVQASFIGYLWLPGDGICQNRHRKSQRDPTMPSALSHDGVHNHESPARPETSGFSYSTPPPPPLPVVPVFKEMKLARWVDSWLSPEMSGRDTRVTQSSFLWPVSDLSFMGNYINRRACCELKARRND
ncbi:hypothetical protein RRG08_050787 [Elysia crispata]|uniref:Uncharacterized protein n=1 Tax=Elysia crispata TaxID=231223 RepID=A0AAE1CYF2_9GAST|nr:hypothetical protein RRG08_050787 [Elysia crispata]